MQTVGVVGLGAVGWAVVHCLSRDFACTGFDVDDDYDWDSVIRADIVFVCVPTPPNSEGRLDCSAVREVLARLSKDAYKGPVVIKSTIGVGFMARATAEFPKCRLVYMPEFLRERSRFSWILSPDRLVLSGDPQDIEETLGFFRWAREAVVIRTSHRSAEVAKLAHNAFIAMKVSFTDEIEQVSRGLGADPSEVMSVVASDRRVLTDAHLKPGLGPYGGKCVPKDVEELAIAGSPRSRLLSHIVSSRKLEGRPVQTAASLRIGVVVPTKNRAEKLSRALASIANQVRLPNEVIVVSDSSGEQDRLTHQVVAKFEDVIPVREVRNGRSTNLAGAVNFGLSMLQSHQLSLTGTYVALLDDDDWWNRHYLDNAACFGAEYDADWVVSGLIRHETRNRGAPLPIPSELSVGDFLVSNPNVQGSNLFVRLSRIVEAGGLDESLLSTTDRDLCIRLLRLPGIHYEVLRNHLVHHDATPDPSRLSTPGSERKRAGLVAFYQKYSAEMSAEQKYAFRERAESLFEVEIPTVI
jgi:UDPglucose 6-dehydrogenase